MLKRYFFLFFLPFVLTAQSYVTYQISGGRFGDHVSNYLEARWAAKAAKLPFVFRPFEYADKFCLINEKRHHISFSEMNIINYFREDPNLVVGHRDLLMVPHFTGFTADAEFPNLYFAESFFIDWRDALFLKEARELFTPLEPFSVIELDEETPSIAIHCRTGGNFDSPKIVSRCPTRFPNEDFYLEGVNTFVEALNPKRLTVVIFSDAIDRKGLRAEFEKKLIEAHPTVLINVISGHGGDLEDFLSLQKFSYMVNAESLFSLNAARLGACQFSIQPQFFSYDVKGRKVYVASIVNDMTYKEEFNVSPLYLECHSGDFAFEMERVLEALWFCHTTGLKLEVYFNNPVFNNLKAAFLKKKGDETFCPINQNIDWNDPLFKAKARSYFSPKLGSAIPLNSEVASIAIVLESEEEVQELFEGLRFCLKGLQAPRFEITLISPSEKEANFRNKLNTWLKGNEASRRFTVRTLPLRGGTLENYLTVGFHDYLVTKKSPFIEAMGHLFGAQVIRL